MGWIFNVDWERLLLPQTPLLEIFIRGSAVYLALFLMLRLVLKREFGAVSLTDVLVIVLLADAAQNALADDYHSIPDGLLLVATIIFWAYTLDYLGYRFRFFEHLVHPPPLLLVEDGKMIRQNMRREFITEEELKSVIREQGLEDISQVEQANLEGDGRISVIPKENGRPKGPERRVI